MSSMELRIVDKSSFSFETDLPASSRNIHPSGILHVLRTTEAANNGHGRVEHIFAWIEDLLHVDACLKHLQEHDYDCSNGLTFIPYSTKRNWTLRYPHAAPALECDGDGKVVVYMNYRPYPNGLGELGEAAPLEYHPPTMRIEKKRKNKAKNKNRNLLQDKAFLPDAERDELHIEIYKYFSWLYFKLSDVQKSRAAKASGEGAGKSTESQSDHEDDTEGDNDNRTSTGKRKRKSGCLQTVDLYELQKVLAHLEYSFAVIPNLESDELVEGGGTESSQIRVPLLEDALDDELTQLVEARKLEGRVKRRSRMQWNQTHTGQGRVFQDRTPGNFDKIYQRLVQFKEDHGGCLTTAQSDAIEALTTKFVMFPHPDGVNRRVPPNYQVTNSKLLPMYLQWHCGDPVKRISPIKHWEKEDVEGMKNQSRRSRTTISEIRKVMRAIDQAATENGVLPTAIMTEAQANACFEAGKPALSVVSPKTPKGRLRNLDNLTWSTVIRSFHVPRKKASAEEASQHTDVQGNDSTSAQSKYATFSHPDGVDRKVPPEYQFADTKLLPMYIQWHCGDIRVCNDEEHHVSPIKLWESIDVQEITADNKRHSKISLAGIRRLMGFIDKVAAENGVPPKADMTQEEVAECFDASKSVLHDVTPKTPTGKQRSPENISWEFIARLLRISRLKQDPDGTSES